MCEKGLDDEYINDVPFLFPRTTNFTSTTNTLQNLFQSKSLNENKVSMQATHQCSPVCSDSLTKVGEETNFNVKDSDKDYLSIETQTKEEVELEKLFLKNLEDLNSVEREPDLCCSNILKEYFGIPSGTFKEKQDLVCLSILQGQSTLAVCPTGWGKSLCYQFPMMVHRLLFEMKYARWQAAFGDNLGRKGVPLPPKSKFCVVISPLLSLMADQSSKITNTRRLKSLVVAAKDEKRLEKEFNAVNANVDILFISPERFISSMLIRKLLVRESDRIAMICVDEVHCVSKWAHDFRPVFMYIHRALHDTAQANSLGSCPVTIVDFMQQIKVHKSDLQAVDTKSLKIPFLCLTATASSLIVKEVETMFQLDRIVIATSMLRHNLRLSSIKVGAEGAFSKGNTTDAPNSNSNVHNLTRSIRLQEELLVEAVRDAPKPLIVYVESRKKAEEWCSLIASKLGLKQKMWGTDSTDGSGATLFKKVNFKGEKCNTERGNNEIETIDRTQDLSIACYHAGQSAGVRTKVQKSFLEDKVNVLVATVAFGLGIDKSNIRSVIHTFTPSSLDEYVQEVGRAGRDGGASVCQLMYNPLDFFPARCRIWSTLLSREEIVGVVQSFFIAPVSRHGDRLILISPARISMELSIPEESVETILFSLLTMQGRKKTTAAEPPFESILGSSPLGYKVQNKKTTEGYQTRSKSNSKKVRKDAGDFGVYAILSEMDVHNPLIEYCDRNNGIANAILCANDIGLSFCDFLLQLEELESDESLIIRSQTPAFLIKVSETFSELCTSSSVEALSEYLYTTQKDRISCQESALKLSFRVLKEPTLEKVQYALEHGSSLKETEASSEKSFPDALSSHPIEYARGLVEHFVKENASRIHSPFDAVRCLLGIMPRSQIKYGKYAGQLPLSQSWYVHSPHFGKLMEFDLDIVIGLVSAFNIDDYR